MAPATAYCFFCVVESVLLELDGALASEALELGEALLEELGEVLLPEDEPLGVLAEPEPDIELDELAPGVEGEVLELEDDGGVLGEDGVVLEPDDEDEPDGKVDEEAPVEDLLLPPDAPGPAVRSQPYRPPTATAMGITTTAVFFSKLIGCSSRWVG